jgi:uridine kinase
METPLDLTTQIFPTRTAPLIIGVAGGSGSGKTTFAQGLRRYLGETRCAVLAQDSYYRDLSHLFDRDGGRVNFDHPETLEFPLMAQHLAALKRGEAIEVPIYDFTSHSRRPAVLAFQPRPVVVVDGILLLSQPEILALLDVALFIETQETVRFDRRLSRDVRERGRSPEGVRQQFIKQVKPMHDAYVEPSKTRARQIISGEQPFEAIFADLCSRLSFDEVHAENI